MIDNPHGSIGRDLAEDAKSTVLSLVPLTSEIGAIIETGLAAHSADIPGTPR